VETADPDDAVLLSAGQVEHTVAPPAAYVPLRQVVHALELVAPLLAEKVPPAHATHEALACSPCAVE
jgi:hypothetical protein